MTKICLLKSRKIFSPLLLVFLVLGACAKNRSPASRFAVQSATSAGVIGCQAVEKNSALRQKVMQLALGVSLQKKANGSTEVSWQANCTASAISPRIVLTAAHCVVDLKPNQIYLILGESPDEAQVNMANWIPAIGIRYHEKFNGASKLFHHDIAVILLGEDIPLERIPRLAKPNQFQFPLDLVAIGYGTTSASSNEEEMAKGTKGLQYVLRKVLAFDPESKTFSINQNDHKGFCIGDSGGPGLAYDPDKKEFVILGVVSNVSMLSGEQDLLDPKGEFNLCIGRGNYTNLLNSEIRTWVQEKQAELLAQLDP